MLIFCLCMPFCTCTSPPRPSIPDIFKFCMSSAQVIGRPSRRSATENESKYCTAWLQMFSWFFCSSFTHFICGRCEKWPEMLCVWNGTFFLKQLCKVPVHLFPVQFTSPYSISYSATRDSGHTKFWSFLILCFFVRWSKSCISYAQIIYSKCRAVSIKWGLEK